MGFYLDFNQNLLDFVFKINLKNFAKLKNIIAKRPGLGIPPSDVDKVVGKKAIKIIKKDELIIYKNLK